MNHAFVRRDGVFAILLVSSVLACGADVEPILDCAPRAGAVPICGFHQPEDLVALPGGRWLLASQMGAMDGSRPGSLALFDVESGAISRLFPPAEEGYEPGDAAPAAGWGDPACPGPPSASFSPHGIDLVARADGELALLVVNHGGREAVEMFEVQGASEGGAPSLSWRGCAVAPERAYLNDVAGLADGSFLVSHMFPRSTGLRSGIYMALGMFLGMDTGYVLSWHPEAGFRQVFGTETAFPNGVETSADGRSLFVASTLGGEVRRIARDTGELEGRAAMPRPDNLTWTSDGRLLVASHTATFSQMQGCQGLERGTCAAPFAIVEIDPDSMATRVLFDGSGSPMGAGTVGLQVGGELFIGSFGGDRILRVPFPSGDREP